MKESYATKLCPKIVHISALFYQSLSIITASGRKLLKRKNSKSFFNTYGTAKKKRPGYLVGNLVATNWPIEKAMQAIGYNQIPTK